MTDYGSVRSRYNGPIELLDVSVSVARKRVLCIGRWCASSDGTVVEVAATMDGRTLTGQVPRTPARAAPSARYSARRPSCCMPATPCNRTRLPDR